MKKNSRPDEMTRYEWSVSRWISSETRLALDPAGRGIYRDLLDLCYMTGSIPSDIGLLCRLTNCTPEEMEATWPVIKKHFEVDKNNVARMISPVAILVRKNYFSFLNEQRRKASQKYLKSQNNKSPEINEFDRVGSAIAQVSPEQRLCQRGRGRGSNNTPVAPSEGAVSDAPLVTRQRAWFDEFWGEVWLKVGKDGAWAKFRARVKNEETFTRFMAGVRRDTPIFLAKERQYQPHPATWISQGRWMDEVDSTSSLFAPGPAYRTADEVLAEQRQRDTLAQAEWEAKQTTNA